MGVADDLLALAGYLARPSNTDPEQAWFRRSISTAYYALFHLLVGEAARSWSGSPEACLGLERAFEHKRMKEVSRAVSYGGWKGWSASPPLMPGELRMVAKAFVDLQEARHEADYDNAKIWTSREAVGLVAAAQSAFQNWRKIQPHPASNEFLLSLLVGQKRVY